MTDMKFPLDFDPTDSETLRKQVEVARTVHQLQQKGDRLFEAMNELYDLRDARGWKGGVTNEEKALVGEIEGLRTDIHRLNGVVEDINAKANAEARAEFERKMAEQAEFVEETDKAKEVWEKEQKEEEKRREEAQAAVLESQATLAVEEHEMDQTVPESIHSDEGTEHASEPAEMDMRDLDDVPQGNYYAMDQPDRQDEQE